MDPQIDAGSPHPPKGWPQFLTWWGHHSRWGAPVGYTAGTLTIASLAVVTVLLVMGLMQSCESDAMQRGRSDERATTAAGGTPVVTSEFIYEAAPFPSCHASTIEETQDGLIVAFFGGPHERHPDVCIYVSRRENGRWTPPEEAADGVGFQAERLPTWNPALFQPKQGPLMLFYKVGPSPDAWWGMLKTSEDGGRTWSAAKRLPDGILGPIKNKPVELPRGDILCPSSTEGGEGWRVHFERTSDLGKTWQATPPINDGVTIGAIQPSILFHKDGRLQAVGRTRQDRVFDVWSRDGGRSWGDLSLLELPNPNSGLDAVTLRDGWQLLVYNHNIRTGPSKGRSPLNVAISEDGKKWSAVAELENDPEAPDGFAYPAVIQSRDGLVHVTYTWQRKRIKHVVLDPRLFKPRPIVDGKWPE